MAISKELRDLYSGNTQDIETIDTVELYHPLISEKINFCNFYTTLDCQTERGIVSFEPSSFGLSFPKMENKGTLEFAFSFFNVDFKYINILNNIINATDVPIIIYYRVYTTDNLSYPQHSVPFEIKIFDITLDNNKIVLSGQQLSSLSKNVPQAKFSTAIFPGLK